MKWIQCDYNGNVSDYIGPNIIPKFKDDKRPATTHLGSSKLFIVGGGVILIAMDVTWRFIQLNKAFKEAIKENKRSLYIYSNVGKSTIVGDQVVDLLREVEYNPKSFSQQDNIHFEPIRIQYHDVLSATMDIIEIQITESDNSLHNLEQEIPQWFYTSKNDK